jgi:hypothetical protein
MTGTHLRYLLRLGGACFAVCAVAWELAAAATTPSPAPTTSPQHTITIEASEGLQIAKQDHKAWYQEGLWPLVGSVAVIMISNTVAIGVVYLQSRRSFNALLRQRKIEFLSLSLNDFYNPLLALIDINGEIFAKTGPSTFPEEHHEREAAALVWKEMKKKILENNREIEVILKTKTHLIHRSHSLDAYKALLVHVAMYETFQKIETDRYADFLFPKEVEGHLAAMRSSVFGELNTRFGEKT